MSNLMLLLAHPLGNTFFRAASRAFYSAGWLQELDSCICWDPDSILARFLPASVAIQLGRRTFYDVPLSLQHSHHWRELGRLLSSSLSLFWLQRHEHGPLSIDAVFYSFDRHVASRLSSQKGLQAIYAYEDAALSSFQAAERLGLRRIYDLPIGYWQAGQRIFQEESELQPEWACTLTGLKDSTAKLARKDQELQLADLVVVPSEFVRSTLQDYKINAKPVVVVPFGSPPPLTASPHTPTSGPLRVIYVGSLGQRKGLSYALEAVQSLGSQVSLTLIGRVTPPECRPLLAALRRHRWIDSLPHHQVLEQMRQHDVLVLPSLFEGYALVISEALSQGLPVITTPNSGASVTIRNGVEGFIVPIRDSLAIAECLQQLADNRSQLIEMREACLRRAAELSWSVYEQGLISAVGNLLSQPV
ncbi:glycosyltransferase family 4 protein [Synechococcus sp. CBW1108]|uniref:glycosyltransferase family 4 protein n=1 Tax=Synechococcus sp. CBW1108 TaxID=1353147 RepID=UPI001E50F8EF|nr:glycosyltransferase family 4 protein [Synechococcus sp. CBW1108]